MEVEKVNLTAIYNYKDQLNNWRSYATINKVITDCEKCSKIHCHKSILLDSGKHICWYCWIKKDSIHGKMVVKPQVKLNSNKTTKIHLRTKPLENKKVNEIQDLKNVSNTNTKIMDDLPYEIQMTKLAQAVLVKHSKPSPMLKTNPTSINLEIKTMNKKNKTLPSTGEKNSQNVASSKVAVESKSTDKTKTAAIDKEQNHVIPAVDYSKFNPYMAQLGVQETKWKRITWNVVKYGLALLLAIFAIISLYFTSMWQNVNNNGFLMNLKIITTTVVGTGDEAKTHFLFNLADLSKIPGVSADYGTFLNFTGDAGVAKMLSTLSLHDLNPAFSEGALNSLIAFAIISIIAIFPLLVFKNGTVCSLAFIATGFVLVIIIISLYSIGISAQNIFVTPFRDINNAAASYGAQPNDILVTRINDNLKALLNALQLTA